jgi:hypothetical protein
MRPMCAERFGGLSPLLGWTPEHGRHASCGILRVAAVQLWRADRGHLAPSRTLQHGGNREGLPEGTTPRADPRSTREECPHLKDGAGGDSGWQLGCERLRVRLSGLEPQRCNTLRLDIPRLEESSASGRGVPLSLIVCRCSPRSSLGGVERSARGLTAAALRLVWRVREEPRDVGLPASSAAKATGSRPAEGQAATAVGSAVCQARFSS